MSEKQASNAPPMLGGKIPCELSSRCKSGLRHVAFYHGRDRRAALHCLRGKTIAMLGDSTMAELMTELTLYLSYDVPDFTKKILRLGYKFSTPAPHTRLESGPLTADFWPNQRNMTLFDARINLTVSIVHAGGLFLTDHMGVQTLSHPLFERELHRLGVHRDTPAARRADFALFGTTFHDDTQLGGASPLRVHLG